MRMPTKREWALLALAPVVILAAAGANREDRENAVVVAEVTRADRTKAEGTRVADAAELDPAQLRREASAGETGNAFESKSWYVPPPPPPAAKPLPPPLPSAPPLPFTYLGRYDDSAKPVIFLVRGDRILLVSAGDVIEGIYRVDGIAGSMLGLTYLPLNIRQTLDIGNAG